LLLHLTEWAANRQVLARDAFALFPQPEFDGRFRQEDPVRVEQLIANRQLRGLGRMPIHEAKIVCP
jgi:hypothetical protein